MNHGDNKSLRGGVLLLGSLLWEGENEMDGENGKKRKTWRDTHLKIDEKRPVAGLPLRYGRKSNSRSGQFTMVFDPMSPDGGGTAFFAGFKSQFEITELGLTEAAKQVLENEVESLARAERIWTDEIVVSGKTTAKANHLHFAKPKKPWGLVGIWINPASDQREAIEGFWRQKYTLPKETDVRDFGATIVGRDCIVTINKWPEALKDIDFCLCTPTRPDTGEWRASDVAGAIITGSYFYRTRDAGISTADDADLLKELAKASALDISP